MGCCQTTTVARPLAFKVKGGVAADFCGVFTRVLDVDKKGLAIGRLGQAGHLSAFGGHQEAAQTRFTQDAAYKGFLASRGRGSARQFVGDRELTTVAH